MASYRRMRQMIDELKAESETLNDCPDVENAKRMLVLSECVTAGLHAYLFKNIPLKAKE